MSVFRVSAPGRICLFGEHQDFLGLPVISMAMNLRFEITGQPRKDRLYRIQKPDIGEEEVFTPSEELRYTSRRDYLKAAVNVLKRRYGLDFRQGYDFVFRSEIPVNAGCGSSSVMVVAWLAALLHLHGRELPPEEIAELGYEAEVAEFGESGGKMDHYTAALGGLLFLDFGLQPPTIERLPLSRFELRGFVLGDSLEPKATVEVLRKSREAAERGFAELRRRMPAFNLRATPLEEVEPFLDALPPLERRVVRAQLIDRDLLRKALQMFRSGHLDPKRLGALLLKHHEMLRDGLGVSTPKIDRMLEAALAAGALGGKVNGSGGGGTMFVYAPGKEQEAAEAIQHAGGRAYVIEMDEGIHITPSTSR